MKLQLHSIRPIRISLACVVLGSAIALTPVNAATTINVDFRATAQTGLEGPAGGAGETWNNSTRDGGQGDTFWQQTALKDSTGTTTGIAFSMSQTGGFFDQPQTAILAMLNNAVFINGGTTTLTITGLDSLSKYDFYAAGYSSGFAGGTAYSTSNTTSTVGTQTHTWLLGAQSSAWVQGQNYVLFEDVVPDVSGNIVITSVRAPSQPYTFYSGFQLVQVPEPSAALLGALGALGLGLRRRRN